MNGQNQTKLEKTGPSYPQLKSYSKTAQMAKLTIIALMLDGTVQIAGYLDVMKLSSHHILQKSY